DTTAEIAIRTAVDEDMGIISVTDKGIGISGEHLPYIFDRFYQAEPINTRKHEGSGLGLAIAKNLVEQMDGIISAESEIGVGSRFTVSFPLADEYYNRPVSLPLEIADVKNSEDEIKKPVSEPRCRNILLIDDDPMIADVVKMMLGESFKLHPAQSGNIGMDILRTHHIDLVLLDWMIPGIDGLSFLVAMKTDERFANIPVIFLSAKAESEIIRMGIEAGADGFITKPFKKEELLNTVTEAVGA
ncbi:MAG: response regulator, partial [bacterium]